MIYLGDFLLIQTTKEYLEAYFKKFLFMIFVLKSFEKKFDEYMFENILLTLEKKR